MIHLILPTFSKNIKEKIINMNNYCEKLNENMQKLNLDYIEKYTGSNHYNIYHLSPPLNIFNILELMKEKNILDPIYKDLLIYHQIQENPHNIKYIGNNLSYFGRNKTNYVKDTGVHYSFINVGKDEFKITIENEKISSNKMLFFKTNRKSLDTFCDLIDKSFQQSSMYYETFKEVFHNNNPHYISPWIDLNSKEIFYFSLYNMSEELQVDALFQYNEKHGNISFLDLMNTLKMINTLFETNTNELLSYNKNKNLNNLKSFIIGREREDDEINGKIKVLFEKVEIFQSLQTELSTTTNKNKKHKI